MKNAVLIVLALQAISVHAVINGSNASLGQTPDDQLIRQMTVHWVTDGANFDQPNHCTGVQVDAYTIMTAAHCVSDDTPEAVRRGRSFIEAFDESAPGRKRKFQVTGVQAINNEHADFALVRVRDRLPSKQSLPMAYGGCDKNSKYVQAGFGLDETNEFSKALRYATFREASEKVKELYESESDEHRHYLEPLTNARACSGDSGGPVYCFKHGRLALYGITNSILNPNANETIRPGSKMSMFCRDKARDLAVTKISDGMNEIERLRQRPVNEPVGPPTYTISGQSSAR